MLPLAIDTLKFPMALIGASAGLAVKVGTAGVPAQQAAADGNARMSAEQRLAAGASAEAGLVLDLMA